MCCFFTIILLFIVFVRFLSILNSACVPHVICTVNLFYHEYIYVLSYLKISLNLYLKYVLFHFQACTRTSCTGTRLPATTRFNNLYMTDRWVSVFYINFKKTNNFMYPETLFARALSSIGVLNY